jgi:tetratricopeptide (TPR) repeat protein
MPGAHRPRELKRLAERDIAKAIVMAEHYRDLNQPEEAESICRDVLDVAPQNPVALKTLGLALTDRFPSAWAHLFEEAIRAFERLPDEYERVYYAGVAWERLAKAHLEHGQAHNAAHAFEQAMARFERAEKVAPPGVPDAILRWNRCVRALLAHPELRDALERPRDSRLDYGD